MDTVFAELAHFSQNPEKRRSVCLLDIAGPCFWSVLGLIVGVAYQRFVIKRLQMASKTTQENFEAIAADPQKTCLGGQEAGRGP